MDWRKLFDAAGLDMSAFQPSAPRWVPAVFADERMAWEGRVPEIPEHTVRIEAAAAFGRPVFFGITGPWTQSARTPAAVRQSGLDRVTEGMTALVMPGLMLVGALLARRNVKLGRGDRKRRVPRRGRRVRPAARVVAHRDQPRRIVPARAAAALRDHRQCALQRGRAVAHVSRRRALRPALLRRQPDRLDPLDRRPLARPARGARRHGRRRHRPRDDAASSRCTTCCRRSLGRPEPLPVFGDPSVLLGVRAAIASVLNQVQNGMTSGMLGIGGFVAMRILLKRRDLAAAAAVLCYMWVVLQGMFTPGYPTLDLVLGFLITATFVLVVGWGGLLATVAALTTHFILLRAPLTLDTSSWRFSATIVMLGAVLAMGLGGTAIATGRFATREP